MSITIKNCWYVIKLIKTTNLVKIMFDKKLKNQIIWSKFRSAKYYVEEFDLVEIMAPNALKGRKFS